MGTCPAIARSVIQPLDYLAKLLPSPLRVSGRGLQVLVARDLREGTQIVAVVGQTDVLLLQDSRLLVRRG